MKKIIMLMMFIAVNVIGFAARPMLVEPINSSIELKTIVDAPFCDASSTQIVSGVVYDCNGDPVAIAVRASCTQSDPDCNIAQTMAQLCALGKANQKLSMMMLQYSCE